MSDGQNNPPTPPMPAGPPPGSGGAYPPPPSAHPQGSAYPPPPQGQPSSASPFPEQSYYGHYQQYSANDPAAPQQPGPYGAPPQQPRSNKAKYTWISVTSATVVAAVLVGVFGLRDPVEEKVKAAETAAPVVPQPGAPGAPGAPGEGGGPGASPSSGSGKGKGITVTGQTKIPTTPPQVLGKTFGSTITSEPSSWPDACELITDEEIKVIFPQAEVSSRKGKVDTLVGSKDSKNNECDIEFQMSGLVSFDYPARISITMWGIDAVSFDPKSGSVDKKQALERFQRSKASKAKGAMAFPGTFDDLGTKLGTDDAYRDANATDIVKNAFKVTLHVSAQLEDTAGKQLKNDTLSKEYGPTVGQLVGAKL